MDRSFKVENLILILLLCVSSFYGGLYIGKRGFDIEIKRNPPSITVLNKNPKVKDADFDRFWKVWEAVNTYYYQRPLQGDKLLDGAISGMVAAIGDDYTSYFTPPQNEQAKSSLNGVYEGIGAELGFKDKQLIIVAPLEGSPAIGSGIRAGDKILEIDGKTTFGISLGEAVTKIRGASGTPVTLKLQTGESDPRDTKITRGKIVSKSVTWRDLGDGIGYLRLSRFGDNTDSEWTASVEDMRRKMPGLRGVILDVRGNPGGYLESATYIASEFVADGNIIFEERADGSMLPYPVIRKGLLINVPTVVLIDEGSASASEIVAGALRDLLQSKLVGMKSFGKGTIQTAHQFDDGSSVHITIAKWLTPNKIWVHQKGLEPDVSVERKVFTQEEIAKGVDTSVDTQLDKAKEVLQNGLN